MRMPQLASGDGLHADKDELSLDKARLADRKLKHRNRERVEVDLLVIRKTADDFGSACPTKHMR